ncbi:MAG: tRNA pseudouridine(38-40) synthase TruA [Ferruginibacter sp.]
MSRFFLEVAYKGTLYAGFQAQKNANTIQDEIEKALFIFLKDAISLTGSSRTDAGVHALHNFFHFDFDFPQMPQLPKIVYHLNAILPPDIVIKNIFAVAADAHCRFDAISRRYEYAIYQQKDPFLTDRGYFYPYKLNMELLNEAALLVKAENNFESFAKRNTQVKTFVCSVSESIWIKEEETIYYRVTANRFLRGMVKGLVGTMLKVGRKKITVEEFKHIIESADTNLADFSVPAHGLKLMEVAYNPSTLTHKL